MKYVVAVFGVICAFLLADFIWSQGNVESSVSSAPGTARGVGAAPAFDHALHGDSIGLDCVACHTGSRSAGHAYLPSKKDCMDCHRLPLTEKPGIEALDSALANAPENPWSSKSILPEHVVFHHGVHSAAGVSCTDCHGTRSGAAGTAAGTAGTALKYSAAQVTMKSCIQCHKGESFKERNFKPAATYCAACHR